MERTNAMILSLNPAAASTRTEYRIEMPQSESKSGATLGKKATITFTTAAPAADEKAAEKLNASIITRKCTRPQTGNTNPCGSCGRSRS